MSKVYSVKLSEDSAAVLDEAIQQSGLSTNAFLREAIAAYLAGKPQVDLGKPEGNLSELLAAAEEEITQEDSRTPMDRLASILAAAKMREAV